MINIGIYNEAKYQLKMKNYKKYNELIKQLYKIEPSCTVIKYEYAQSLRRSGQIKLAVKLFNELLETYIIVLEFSNKFIEIRPSGTDAKTKAYGAGDNKDEIKLYAKILGNYSGDLTDLYKSCILDDYYENIKEKSMQKYLEFTNKDANNDKFVIPDYKFMIN